jgi:hypothetical protein
VEIIEFLKSVLSLHHREFEKTARVGILILDLSGLLFFLFQRDLLVWTLTRLGVLGLVHVVLALHAKSQ